MSHHNIIVNDCGYEGINPVLFGYENCKSDHSYGPAVRKYYLVHFVVSGFGYFYTNNQEYKIGPGEMFIIKPYEETFYKASTDDPWNYIWIGFTADNLPIPLTSHIRCPEAFNIFNSMKKCSNFENGKSAYLCSKLWELFSLLLENERHSLNYIDKALDCIHSEYMKNISVEEIAGRLNLDRSYFTTLFTKKVGIAPGKYLFEHRMSIAASLLKNNSVSVTVAANSVGYSDIFNFSKMFKKYFGTSPTNYIKQHKSN